MSKSITLTRVILEKRTLQFNEHLVNDINSELKGSYDGPGKFTDVQDPVTINDLEAIWNETWRCYDKGVFAWPGGFRVPADDIARDVMKTHLYGTEGWDDATVVNVDKTVCLERLDPIVESHPF